MKLLKTSAILGIGILIGSVITSTITKKKYEEIIDEEIQSVKDRYSKEEDYISRFLDTIISKPHNQQLFVNRL